MKYDVFISYSRRDIDLVKSIKAAIEEAAKVVCWMDLKAIESGSKRFTKDIIDGINNCGVFLFMLSENSQASWHHPIRTRTFLLHGSWRLKL